MQVAVPYSTTVVRTYKHIVKLPTQPWKEQVQWTYTLQLEKHIYAISKVICLWFYYDSVFLVCTVYLLKPNWFNPLNICRDMWLYIGQATWKLRGQDYQLIFIVLIGPLSIREAIVFVFVWLVKWDGRWRSPSSIRHLDRVELAPLQIE